MAADAPLNMTKISTPDGEIDAPAYVARNAIAAARAAGISTGE